VFGWIWSLLTSRCFSNPWGMSCLVSWAELINHENVDCTYDFYVQGESVPEEVEVET